MPHSLGGAARGLIERLAAYKTPRINHVIDALPKGATSKVLEVGINRADLLSAGSGHRRPA